MPLIITNVQNVAEFLTEIIPSVGIFIPCKYTFFVIFKFLKQKHRLPQEWSLLGKVIVYIKRGTLTHAVNHILIFNKPLPSFNTNKTLLLSELKYV